MPACIAISLGGNPTSGNPLPVPPAACDCHVHVFGPPDRYPGISGHSYALREAQLSGAYRVSQRASDFSDATPIARMLIQANPRRVVWGSDWPHTGLHAGRPQQGTVPMITFRDLDDSMLVDLLAEQAGNVATFRRILFDNPHRLYGF